MPTYFDDLAESWDQDPIKNERARTAAEYCKKVPLSNRKSLLDFGGGTGLLSFYLRNSFEAITIADTSTEMLRVARKKIEASGILNISTYELKHEISEIPGPYSAVISLMTLHHILDLETFFSGAFRILEAGGALMIADLYKEDGSFHKDVKGFKGHNGFETERLSKIIEKAGFKVSKISRFFEIKKKNFADEDHIYPLFFLAAEKQG